MNPILATCMGLGYYFNSYRGQPVVRKGGAVILYHPVKPEFNQLHHPSYVDFYEEVLAESTDPAVIEAKFEQQYATDPWYIHLYRTSHAYHGVHPFYMWYWAAHAMDHVGDVIWVGADRRAVQRLGFRAASSLADALEMASGTVGRSPSITLPAQPAATCWRTSADGGFVPDVPRVAPADGGDRRRTHGLPRLALGSPVPGAAIGRALRAGDRVRGLPDRVGAQPVRADGARGRAEGRPGATLPLPGQGARRGPRRAGPGDRPGDLRGQPCLATWTPR